MTKRVWVGIIVCLSLLLMVLVWVIRHPIGGSGKENALRVGVVLPLTGDLAAYGNNAKDGIELAAQEQNDKASQTQGMTVRLFEEDSQGQAQIAVSAFQQLIAIDHVSCVIGDVASSPTLAMAPIADRRRIVLLSPAASSPDISKAGPFVFRDWPSDDFEASRMAGYMKERGYRRIGVLLVNNDYGQAMLRRFSEQIQSFGAVVVDTETFPQNTVDVRTQLIKLKASHPQVLYLISYPKDTIVFLRQYSELGLKVPIVSTSSFEDPQILKTQGQVAEGVVFTSPIPPSRTDAAVEKFRVAYEKKYGKEPGLVADYAYDALRLLVEAAKLSGGTTGDDLKSGLHKIKDFHGASGLINFDANGDVIKTVGLKTVKDGKYVWLE